MHSFASTSRQDPLSNVLLCLEACFQLIMYVGCFGYQQCTVRLVRLRGKSAIVGDAVPQSLEPVANRLRPLVFFLQNRLHKNGRSRLSLAWSSHSKIIWLPPCWEADQGWRCESRWTALCSQSTETNRRECRGCGVERGCPLGRSSQHSIACYSEGVGRAETLAQTQGKVENRDAWLIRRPSENICALSQTKRRSPVGLLNPKRFDVRCGSVT